MKSLITRPLGLYGWDRLEPVLLAALLSEEPLLLVGPHGCAKSFVLERLAESLGLAFRCYNASLLNYDDLVGIPMPNADRTALDYIKSSECIWDAEVVFIDEINRTRPDLQNKIFPIIHERRVQGRDLKKLRYRWAAMNPPPSDDEELDGDALYLGAERLDAALADRFPFIVSVPAWDDLETDDKLSVLIDQFEGRHEFPVAIGELVADAKLEYDRLVQSAASTSARYTMMLVTVLRTAKYDVSTRRATMLQRTLLAIHAARIVLARHARDGEAPTLLASAQLAVRTTLPDRARRQMSDTQLVALCNRAWELAAIPDDDESKCLLLEPDPVRRLEMMTALKINLPAKDCAAIVCEGVAAAKEPLRRGLALASFLALRDRQNLPASAVEILAKEIEPAITPSKREERVPLKQGRMAGDVSAIRFAMAKDPFAIAHPDFLRCHDDLLNSFLPDGYASSEEAAELSRNFLRLWRLFDLK